MSLRPDEDLSHVQQNMDNVLIEGAKGIQSVVGELIQTGIDLNQQKKSSNLKREIGQETTQRDLWDKYSQGIEARIPAHKTLAVAQNALRDGISKETAVKMISSDPEFQRLSTEHSPQKAQKYAALAVSAARRKDLVAQQSKQLQKQHQRQKSKGFELEN